MNKKYYFKTITECKEYVIDKTITLDIINACITNALSCISRVIRVIFIWAISLLEIFTLILQGPKQFFILLAIQLIIYGLWSLLKSWVKFNYKDSYTTIKVNLVDTLIDHCKEWDENEYEEWQKKQILKDIASYANIEINWDKVDKVE